MIWDYRPLIGPPDPAESQQGDLEPGGKIGINHDNNCGPAVFAQVMSWLGNGDPHEPQEIAGKGYVGGMTTAYLWGRFQKLRADYPHWPEITVQQGGDPVKLGRQAAASHFPMVAWFWSDGNAVVKWYNTGIRHWCAIVADTGSELVLRNPEWSTDVILPYATARLAYVGEFTTFHLALGGREDMIWTASLRRTLVWPVFVLLFGRNPGGSRPGLPPIATNPATGKPYTGEEELMAIVNVVQEDLGNWEGVQVAMWNDPRAVAWRALQNASIAQQSRPQTAALPPTAHALITFD